ncbi:hypothetical protein B0I35DRAFT_229243 [Stachybotrys elegans]|uniref:Uncharacterized protein n=1 Tax=Stachybotrys elegans TaxID=80388 RepID=A0A8K0ST28_9HYPO|nr:hypothetical protein B0I35DRAFT_229243 [Stachybotrys elegans]
MVIRAWQRFIIALSAMLGLSHFISHIITSQVVAFQCIPYSSMLPYINYFHSLNMHYLSQARGITTTSCLSDGANWRVKALPQTHPPQQLRPTSFPRCLQAKCSGRRCHKCGFDTRSCRVLVLVVWLCVTWFRLGVCMAIAPIQLTSKKGTN